MTVKNNNSRCLLAACLLLWVAALAPAQEPPPASDAAGPSASEAAHATYQRLIEEKRYDEAVVIARQLVDLATRLHGERSLSLAAPLENLARAQFLTGDLAGAEASYRASIAIIERAEGIGSPRLVSPLTGLGDTYHEADLHQQARETYELALRANHAAEGFYNLGQVPILDGLSESYLALDKLAEANAQQRYQVTVQQRRSGPDGKDVVPALTKLARWYNRTGQYEAARGAYQAARRTMRASSADATPAMVDTLIGEAIAWQNEGAMPASVGALKRALELLDGQPMKDHLKRAEVLVNLGDLYTLNRQERAARQCYVEAWRELSGDESMLEQRERYFGQPARIAGPRLPEFVGPGGDDKAAPRIGAEKLAKGHLLASLTVDAGGSARDAVIVEADPPGLLDARLLRTLQATAFRPRMQDGEAVASEGVQFRHEFRYTPGSSSKQGDDGDDDDRGKPISYPGADNDDEPEP